MANSNESLRDKLIVAFFEVLVFGVLLAGLGYWIDLRLEAQKQAFADEIEKTKAVTELLKPIARERLNAYLEIRSTARSAVAELDIYYSVVPRAGSIDDQTNQLRRLENKMGVGSGGTGSGWSTHAYAANAVNQMIVLRTKYSGVASNDIQNAMKEFIKVLMNDLNEGLEKENDQRDYRKMASERAHVALKSLEHSIENALHFEKLQID